MAWIKISNDDGGTYGKEPDNDPVSIVSVNAINERISQLIIERDTLISKKAEYDGTNQSIIDAISIFNSDLDVKIEGAEKNISYFQKLLGELDG